MDEGELDGSFGPKTKMMEQKAFWMHTKMFSTFTTNKMIHGSSVAFKAEDQEKAKGKDAVERAAQRLRRTEIL